MSPKFSIPEQSNASYYHRSLKVSGDPVWTFNGTVVITDSRNVGGKAGTDTTLTLYQTVGGSYIATLCIEPQGTNKAKIIETVEDLKSFFGNSGSARHIYELLARQNPNIANELVGDFMKVIK